MSRIKKSHHLTRIRTPVTVIKVKPDLNWIINVCIFLGVNILLEANLLFQKSNYPTHPSYHLTKHKLAHAYTHQKKCQQKK